MLSWKGGIWSSRETRKCLVQFRFGSCYVVSSPSQLANKLQEQPIVAF